MAFTSVKTVGMQLLRDLGVTSLDPAVNANNLNARGLTTGDTDAIVLAINGALQEIFMDGPAAINEAPFSDVMRPPTDVTCQCVQYSKILLALTPALATYQKNCTIRIAGDEMDNWLAGASLLGRPYMGTSGAGKVATIYSDVVPLDSTIDHVLDPVRITSLHELRTSASRVEFDRIAGAGGEVRTLHGVNASYMAVLLKQIGIPTDCFTDSVYDPTSVTGLPLYLRVTPMPSAAYPISFRARIKPPVIVAADLGTAGADPDIKIPLNWLESILFPIARQRLTGDALFTNDEGKPEILRQYNLAKKLLMHAPPQISAKEAFYPKAYCG